MIKPNEISDILKSKLEEVDKQAGFEEIGTVLEVGDGVAHVYGLDNVKASELVEFENGVRGVYVLRGSVVHFRKVDIIYNGSDYCLVAENGEDDENYAYLGTNELIITNGKNLFDGRILG